jgi:quinoprotein glucose dehydrogenase
MDFFSAGLGAPTVDGIPLVNPPWGRITAVDMKTGEHKWMVANGDAPKNIKEHPLLTGVDVGRTGKITRIGSLVTKTLLFAGEGYGGDPFFYAYDKDTGAIIASVQMPAAQSGMPMTYMHNGKQYIVMTIGAQGHPAELIAYTLEEEKPEGQAGQ